MVVAMLRPWYLRSHAEGYIQMTRIIWMSERRRWLVGGGWLSLHCIALGIAHMQGQDSKTPLLSTASVGMRIS